MKLYAVKLADGSWWRWAGRIKDSHDKSVLESDLRFWGSHGKVNAEGAPASCRSASWRTQNEG